MRVAEAERRWPKEANVQAGGGVRANGGLRLMGIWGQGGWLDRSGRRPGNIAVVLTLP